MDYNAKVQAAVARGKQEIVSDVERAIVPADVECFSDLHDHVDANEYGGLCDDGEWESHEQWLQWGNEVQGELDAWLRGGGVDRALLAAIFIGTAFRAEVEDSLQERGLIVQTHEPYARITAAGRRLLV